MKLIIENIGKIGKAEVEINGITVIAGENNTGKSTIGRSLFSVFNSFYNIKDQIMIERTRSIGNLTNIIYGNFDRSHLSYARIEKNIQNINDNLEFYKDNLKEIKRVIMTAVSEENNGFEKAIEDPITDEVITRINDVIKISDIDIFNSVLEKNLQAEFNGQINNIFSETCGKIQIQIRDEEMTVLVNTNDKVSVDKKIDLDTEAVYIDDPFIFDESQSIFMHKNLRYRDHRTHLKLKLITGNKDITVIDEIIANKKIEEIYKKISKVCDGEIVSNKQASFGYKKAGSEKILDAKNLSTGLKTFVILKMLLLNGTIENNGTIILDEPEIHLHPEWQLLFAELIVLLQKAFNMHILLNTHSPYFLNAIEVYSQNYEIAGKCKYYLASMDGDVSNLEDVSNDLEKIYIKLARPLQTLENERYKNE